MRSALLSIAAATLLLGGCTSEFTFTDSVNSRVFEFMPRAEFGDELSTPYVLGAEFTIYIASTERDTKFEGWKVQVTDPSVLQLQDREPRRLDENTLALSVVAANVGSAELLLVDPSGEIQGSAAAEVRRPTRVKLFSSAISALENPDFRGETPRPHVVTGGIASFAVQYFDVDLKLQGSTDLRTATGSSLAASVIGSEAADNRDVLQIVAGETTGPQRVELFLGRLPLQVIDVEVVRPSAIAAIDLIDRKGATPDEAAGEWLVVAQAYNDVRQPIYGVEFTWLFPGKAFQQNGDVLLYEHDPSPDSFKRVVAAAHGLEAAVSVQAFDAEVFSSNDEAFNCSVTGDAPPAWWALVLLVAGARRRRR